MWRVVWWARRTGTPVLLVSDSNVKLKARWWKRVPKEVVVRYFYRHVDGALFMHEHNRQYHMRYGLPAERLWRGTMPIDRERLLAAVPDRAEARREVRERHGIPPDAFVVILCGKYTPRKRQLDLAEAACGAARSGCPVWALLVGEGPERAAIEAYCRREGATNVVLTGFVNQSRVPLYYAASDAVCLPSSDEPNGLVVSEGAAFGLPVLVSDTVGCVGPDEVARPGVNAFAFPCGDAGALRTAIETLAADGDVYARMSRESEVLSRRQDVGVTAFNFAHAGRELARFGPRRGLVSRERLAHGEK
jgi:glycosyltransferase involved in cell wall biosynthesis